MDAEWRAFLALKKKAAVPELSRRLGLQAARAQVDSILEEEQQKQEELVQERLKNIRLNTRIRRLEAALRGWEEQRDPVQVQFEQLQARRLEQKKQAEKDKERSMKMQQKIRSSLEVGPRVQGTVPGASAWLTLPPVFCSAAVQHEGEDLPESDAGAAAAGGAGPAGGPGVQEEGPPAPDPAGLQQTAPRQRPAEGGLGAAWTQDAAARPGAHRGHQRGHGETSGGAQATAQGPEEGAWPAGATPNTLKAGPGLSVVATPTRICVSDHTQQELWDLPASSGPRSRSLLGSPTLLGTRRWSQKGSCQPGTRFFPLQAHFFSLQLKGEESPNFDLDRGRV